MSITVILSGNTGSDPKVVQTKTGKPMVSLSVCTKETFRDKNGNSQTRDEWHKVIAYDTLANNIANVVGKGSRIKVMGKIRNTQYEKDGITHNVTEIVADEVIFDKIKNLETATNTAVNTAETKPKKSKANS